MCYSADVFPLPLGATALVRQVARAGGRCAEDDARWLTQTASPPLDLRG